MVARGCFFLKKPHKPKPVRPVGAKDLVSVRRQWNSWEVAEVYVGEVSNPLWDIESGGVKETAPDAQIYGYVFCDAIVSGSLAHSCIHGTGPHSIKVCILRKDNPPRIYNYFLELAGPKPATWQR
jgi:hypothetical protein